MLNKIIFMFSGIYRIHSIIVLRFGMIYYRCCRCIVTFYYIIILQIFEFFLVVQKACIVKMTQGFQNS